MSPLQGPHTALIVATDGSICRASAVNITPETSPGTSRRSISLRLLGTQTPIARSSQTGEAPKDRKRTMRRTKEVKGEAGPDAVA